MDPIRSQLSGLLSVLVLGVGVGCDAPPATPSAPRAPGDVFVVEPAEPECRGPVPVVAPVPLQYGRGAVVTFDASATVATAPEFEWILLQAPPNSAAALVPNDATATLALDEMGAYAVEVRVAETADGERRVSCRPTVAFAGAAPEVRALLQWPHAGADLDLHVVRSGGELFDANDDVSYRNRAPTGAPWSDNADENPTLSFDDQGGDDDAAEAAEIVAPAEGSAWQFVVHAFEQPDDVAADATLHIYVRGVIVFSGDVSLLRKQAWSAVELRWIDDGPELHDIDVVTDLPNSPE